MTPADDIIQSRFSDLNILLVEDNFLVALDMQRMLEDIGFRVVGPAASIAEGLALLDAETIAGAILDINIIGGTSAAIAEELVRRQTPFFFVTGYASPSTLPESLKRLPRLNKPVDDRALRAAACRSFASPNE